MHNGHVLVWNGRWHALWLHVHGMAQQAYSQESLGGGDGGGGGGGGRGGGGGGFGTGGLASPGPQHSEYSTFQTWNTRWQSVRELLRDNYI